MGGGWDSNLSGAASTASPVSSVSAGVRAGVGATLSVGERAEAALELRYRGAHHPELPGLNLHRGLAAGSWAYFARNGLSLDVELIGGLRWGQDMARSGWEAGVSAGAGYKPWSDLTLRADLGVIRVRAKDAVYSRDAVRVGLAAELRTWAGAALVLDYGLEAGTGTFYAPLPATSAALAAGPGSGGGSGGSGGGNGGPPPEPGESTRAPGARQGRVVSTFPGDYLVAYVAGQVAHSAGVELLQRVGARWSVRAAYAFTVVRGAEQDYQAHCVWSWLAWRW